MKKIVMVGLLIAVVLLIAAFLTSTVMAAEKDVVKMGAAKTILIDKTSVSTGFSPASTYIMLAQGGAPVTRPLTPPLPTNEDFPLGTPVRNLIK